MSEEWILDIYEGPLESIQTHGKEVEGRVPDPDNPDKRYGDIEEGDVIRFRLVEDEPELLDLAFEVEYNTHYDTIREMLDREGVERTLPSVDSIDEGVDFYHSLPSYEERIEQYGVNAIGLGDQV